MLRRIVASLAAALMIAAGIGVSSPVASAAGACTLSVPNRIVIGHPYMAVTLRASGPCATSGGYGSWVLYHPTQGGQAIAIFDGAPTDIWNVYSWDVKFGRQNWRPSWAWDGGYNDLAQNSPDVDVRLATAAWISSSRYGSTVTLKGTSLVYSTGNDSYFKRSAGAGFQYRERGSTTWRTLKSMWTSSAGTTTMSYRSTARRDYRFVLYTTPISWDQASATTTR
ncbi:MAG: hypothetical protein ABI662_10870 [Dermatophilaceae bacterium]